jgi:hypothetical protein
MWRSFSISLPEMTQQQHQDALLSYLYDTNARTHTTQYVRKNKVKIVIFIQPHIQHTQTHTQDFRPVSLLCLPSPPLLARSFVPFVHFHFSTFHLLASPLPGESSEPWYARGAL